MPPSPVAIDALLQTHPAAGLIKAPAVIHRLDTISALVGREVYILRDDLTGFGIGGNKTRKVDFLLGDAARRHADTLVTRRATSFSRNAAFGAAARGLELHVVVPGAEADHNTRSRGLFAGLGAHQVHIPDADGVEAVYADLVTSLRKAGRRVYELHPGGSDAIGTLGYLDAFRQIAAYSTATGVHFAAILLSIGSCGTLAGLALGQHLSGYATGITGFTARLPAREQRAQVDGLLASLGATFDMPTAGIRYEVDDGFIGPGYALPSPEGAEAAALFARREGILLDSVYTAKAAAAMLVYARSRAAKGETILFVHTGGNADLYY